MKVRLRKKYERQYWLIASDYPFTVLALKGYPHPKEVELEGREIIDILDCITTAGNFHRHPQRKKTYGKIKKLTKR